MKKPHVLNRPMFNKGGTSAYGRGITSNLVSDEQRQRFNYGGRVGYAGLPYPKRRYTDQFVAPYSSPEGFNLNLPKINTEFIGHRGTGKGYGLSRQLAEEEQLKEELSGMEKSEQDIFYDAEREKARFGESDKYTTGPDGIGLIEKKIEEVKTPGGEEEREVMTDSDWMELLGPTPEQTKRTKGKAQLGLAAGALDVFSQPTIAKGMRAASPHLLKLGETATADQAARDKAILQGKVLEKVYRGRETEKGKQARLTAEAKTTPSTAKETYDASIALVLSKDPTPSDGDIAAAFWNATRVNPIILKGGKKEDDLKADEATIAGADEEDVFLLNRKWHMKKGGKLVPISEEIALKLKG